jgi:DNA-binding NarL/FixJ family response regulator
MRWTVNQSNVGANVARLSVVRSVPTLPGSHQTMKLSAPKTRVLIADDHRVWTDGLELSLEGHGIQTVAVIHDGAKIVEACLEKHPDVVLLDINLPGQDGLEVLEEIRTRRPEILVLILTGSSDPTMPRRVLDLGAAGFLSKSSSGEELARAIRNVVDQGSSGKGTEAGTPAGSQRFRPIDLTPTEMRVLALLAHGLDNAAIAEEMTVSENTVKTHVGNLLSKLELPNRTQAAMWAIAHGYAA